MTREETAMNLINRSESMLAMIASNEHTTKMYADFSLLLSDVKDYLEEIGMDDQWTSEDERIEELYTDLWEEQNDLMVEVFQASMRRYREER